MKKAKLIFIVLSCTFFSINCLADIRPSSVKENGIVKQAEIKGRRLLNKVAKKYGGVQNYLAKKSASAIISDRWSGFMARTMFMPWHKNNQKLRFDWLLNSDNSRLEFLEDPEKGEVWGIQNWATYSKMAKRSLIFKQDKDIKFWLPTIEYFTEAAFRLQKAEIILYAGEVEVNKTTYQLVFISWAMTQPQKNIDQYVVYINKKTGIIDFLAYTVRDMMPFVKGIMYYRDHKIIDGILIPHLMTVVNGLDDHDFLHEIKIHSFKFNDKLDITKIIPKPDLQYSK